MQVAMLTELVLLFTAGFGGGVLNSVAGGGSFITFPALLFVGIPPVSANATNTFASCAGYISGTYAFRKDLYPRKRELPLFIAASLIGGLWGAWLLLEMPEALFRKAIPWLLLFATVVFAFGSGLNLVLKRLASGHRHFSSAGTVLLYAVLVGVCVYGGFFNAGLGIIVLSYLALAGYSNINAMNGLKLLVSSVVSLVAIAVFVSNGLIAWYQGTVILIGTLVGGYVAARVSRRIPQLYVRYFVILSGMAITVYFFFDTYG